MDVAGRAEQIRVDERTAQIADGAERGELGAVLAAREHHVTPVGRLRSTRTPRMSTPDSSSVRMKLPKGSSPTTPRSRRDRGFAAAHAMIAPEPPTVKVYLLDQALRLSPGRLKVAAPRHEVGVRVARRQEVRVRHGVGKSPHAHGSFCCGLDIAQQEVGTQS